MKIRSFMPRCGRRLGRIPSWMRGRQIVDPPDRDATFPVRFVGVRTTESAEGGQKRPFSPAEGGGRGRMDFEWAQHSMFYRGSTLAGCLRSSTFVPRRVASSRSSSARGIRPWEE